MGFWRGGFRPTGWYISPRSERPDDRDVEVNGVRLMAISTRLVAFGDARTEVEAVLLVAQPLASEELGHHHPPRVNDQLGHVSVIQPREVAAHPVEPQVGLAGKEEQIWVAGH